MEFRENGKYWLECSGEDTCSAKKAAFCNMESEDDDDCYSCELNKSAKRNRTERPPLPRFRGWKANAHTAMSVEDQLCQRRKHLCVCSQNGCPSPQEVIRETNLKRNISKEFSKVLKLLQQRHMNAEDPIYSDDEANCLCNILEAVFLHGLKDSITTKLVSYVNFASQTPDSRMTINFWNFVVKFTHKDVISQLKQLPQISTDIGLCRAWVRMALNDGLMESYLHSVIADSKTLQGKKLRLPDSRVQEEFNVRYYYHTTAYLMDHEQPGILKSYLSGLMTLTFQLSYNSSVLNDWTSTPLVLAGIVDSQTPTPIFNVRGEKKQAVDNKSNLHPLSRTPRSRSHDRTNDGAVIANSQLDGLHTPPNTPCSVQGFTRADMEAIKELTMASSRYTASECSSSSHISCPDPSNGNVQSLDPSLIENQILEEIMAQNEADLRKANYGRKLNHSPSVERKDFRAIPDMQLREKSQEKSLENSPKPKKREIVSDESKPSPSLSNAKHGNESIDPTKSVEEHLEVDANSVSCDTLVGEGTETSITTIPDTQISENISDSLCDLISKTNDSSTAMPVLNTLDEKTELPLFGQFTPPVSPTRRKSSPVELVLSSAVADNIKTASIEDERLSLSAVHDLISRANLYSSASTSNVPVSANTVEASTDMSGSPRNLGNKLIAMSGWSSEFEHSGEYLSEKNLARFESSTEELQQARVASRAESFRTLLKNYAPRSSQSPGPSLDQVIQNLPRSSVSEMDTVDVVESPKRLMKTQSSEEHVDDDFEIVERVPQMSHFESPSNPNSRLAHFRVIAVEKGLDSQNYQCKGCTRPVGLIYGNPRVCSFDGGYYCFECHENDECCIPAYIVYNWDFRKQKVSKVNKEYLQQMEEQPVLDLEELNPRIYEHVQEMEDVRVLRQQLCSLKTYLFSCNQTIAVDLRKKVWPREHMYDSRHLYSLADLLQIPSGQLSKFLKEVVKFASKHVYECSLCCQKGFICEVCNNSRVIYPFEVDSTYKCSQCKAVYHKTCMNENLPCPKCVRWRLRKDSFGASPADSEDYAFTPP